MEIPFSKSQTSKYLNRIKYSDDLSPTLNLLYKLQKQHLLNVPFENLDIQYGNKIDLDIDKIYDKIINRTRGGFCYELNGLFNTLLKSLGFETKIISARVFNRKSNEYSTEYDHLAVLVQIEECEYLADIGFGEFAFNPLKFELNNILHDERGDYIFDKYDNEYFRVSKIENDEIVPQYIFKNIHREFSEFSEMCSFHQTNPKSHFTQNKLISLPNRNGRISLSGDKFKITENGNSTEIPINNEEEFSEKLKQYFNIELISIQDKS